jgi:prevent-host-death family protein
MERALFWPSIARIQEIGVATYSIAQAKDYLSKLIDEALAGEEVTITRHGKPVAYLQPARATGGGRPRPN